MISDPIADMLTRIRNGLLAGMSTVEVPASKLKVEIARILKEEGYIEDYSLGEQKPFSLITINLKYHGSRRERKPVITHIQRVSKPGRRVYRSRADLPRVMSGIGIAIVTTPKGVMTAQQARREHVGGEVLCYVW
ncbi:MAG: 30S ribosomal protein S8 [Anaerolineae bacterium]|jgi:small subunit ribosomal protein S8|uniref:30S ribosomal protein S8 n=1 Tax=Candidatus Flexifilum breve TaxID=3140694 RepID=UPI001AD4580F|nr:30S ribosomal protein S8 [Chloroflexota bacterium]MBK9748612.1 30S ribosomal protein S8 [Chloroflexota bacterium]MBN8634461.1 30S ribosomal protein S8 [Anaerolineae bacterium]